MKKNIWSYGITAVPSRADTLLPRTLASLIRAGFESPAIFLDGRHAGVEKLAAELSLPIITRTPPVGSLANWMTTLVYLYTTAPFATHYAIFEDDCVACANLKEYLQQYHIDKCYLNLLTHNENLVLTGGELGWHESNQRGRGAVGLVFNRQGVKTILGSQHFYEFPQRAAAKGQDGLVIHAMKEAGYRELVHYPSLLQHTGQISANGGKLYLDPVKGFIGEDYDPMEKLNERAASA